jgi:hypothetical protein
MIPRLRVVVFSIVIIAAAVGSASAQDSDQAEDQGRFRLGPLRFTPFISVTSLGVDDNVFNEQVEPKSDTTGAIGPAVNLWIHAGRSLLTAKLASQYLYFKTYKNQRAWNTADDVKWEIPLARLTPFVIGSYTNTKNRPGYEIDSRAHLRTGMAGIGTSVRLSGITSLVLSGSRSKLAFDDDEIFFGTNLAEALNRTTQAEAMQLRLKLTTLTTFVVSGEALQDRFSFDRSRNANSIKVMPGFELRPAALISGHVFVGFRQFDALDRSVPDYHGPIASVGTIYTAAFSRIGVTVNRDLVYSYEPLRPYYALTDVRLDLTERLGHTWDVVASAGRQSLDYKQLASLAAEPARTDTIRQYGAGIGYRVGPILRLGFDALYYSRHSTHVELFDFDGLRFGASVSYGLPQ